MSSDFPLNSIMGRLAEYLIQDLFTRNGYNVFNYGLERVHPFLSRDLKFNNHTTSRVLRFMPDFVVQHSGEGDLFYLEVKFRANGCFKFDDQYKDYPYKNAWFVVVSPAKIQCMHYKRLAAGFGIGSDTSYTLGRVRSFHLSKESIAEYEGYARQVFEGFKKETVE